MRQFATKCCERLPDLDRPGARLDGRRQLRRPRKKKDKKRTRRPTDPADDLKSAMRVPDSQAIDQAIGEALGYWQIGDADSLHKYYADDVVVVSGAWEPPDHRLGQFSEGLSGAARASQRRANGPVKYSHQGEWQFRLGHLSICVYGA